VTKQTIFIAGHKGMVGSALVRLLKAQNIRVITKERRELDLLKQKDVENFFKKKKIDQVYLAAAKVGGIYANMTYPAEFIYENLMIQTNVIHGAFMGKVKKLLFLGSSCIYPRNAPQPIKENYLLSGKLEPSNEPYAIAKIAGIKMCESYNKQYYKSHKIDFRCVMPTNLYGPGDNYSPLNSHVIPALIYRFHKAKVKNLSSVKLWGTGAPKREFMFVDDMVHIAINIMNIKRVNYYKQIAGSSHINIGSGIEISIKKLAGIIKEVIGYKGKIIFDKSKPNGTPRKIMNSKIIKKLGFKYRVNLKEGLIETYRDFLKNENI
jgi:GDP-L-fucose synthase